MWVYFGMYTSARCKLVRVHTFKWFKCEGVFYVNERISTGMFTCGSEIVYANWWQQQMFINFAHVYPRAGLATAMAKV